MATAPPPSYNDTIGEAPGAPPSYTDLFPMKQLKSEVSHAREDGLSPSVPMNICGLFCKSIACGICYLLLALLPVSMIVIGSIYFHKCDIEPRIPLFLVVFGSAALLQTILHLLKMCLCRKKEDDRNSDTKEKGGNFCESLITLFLFVWIIVGSYYTFRSFSPWYEEGQMSCSGDSTIDDCCDPPVMYFSFVVLIMMYGITALSCFCFCCCVCCITMIASASSGN